MDFAAERPPDASPSAGQPLSPHHPRYDAAFAHPCGIAFTRHLDAPREVQALIASRHLREWDPAFVANPLRDGRVLYARGPLQQLLAALTPA